jgi:hypothetical protein
LCASGAQLNVYRSGVIRAFALCPVNGYVKSEKISSIKMKESRKGIDKIPLLNNDRKYD